MRAIERVVQYMGAKPSGRCYFVFEFQLEFWHYRGICTVGWGDSTPKAERKRELDARLRHRHFHRRRRLRKAHKPGK